MKKFKSLESLWASTFSLAASLLFWAVDPTVSVPIYAPVFLTVFIWFLIYYIIILKSRHKDELDNIESLKPQIKVVSFNGIDLCLSSNFKDFMNIGSFITLFYVDNKFERFYAVAKLINIQSNGLIQATILKQNYRISPPNKNQLVIKLSLNEDGLQFLSPYNPNNVFDQDNHQPYPSIFK